MNLKQSRTEYEALVMSMLLLFVAVPTKYNPLIGLLTDEK
jgi:hypothetical protein